MGSSGDFSSISNSSTISIFEETAIRENKYLSKITKLLGKNITFIVALSGNITAQMIISTTVAKTPWNWQTIKEGGCQSYEIINYHISNLFPNELFEK
ncbi:hypothetical protein [Spiroplasma endosymbiont of Amphimallon solstitiale]|uniref:hypothetical protein n=1 Tax=Spiroplasma endosymbiont of Amphimallon solstitiale TaxID=3066288 RepID=UPI00313C973E